jgi:Arc/MetJ family transcription regulator
MVTILCPLCPPTPARPGWSGYPGPVIFKRIGEGRPYPDHGRSFKEWAEVAPRQIRLDQLITTKRHLDLDALLSQDSTFYGDLFAHVVHWRGGYYLEDGLHRAVRAALQQRTVLHARVLDLDE